MLVLYDTYILGTETPGVNREELFNTTHNDDEDDDYEHDDDI